MSPVTQHRWYADALFPLMTFRDTTSQAQETNERLVGDEVDRLACRMSTFDACCSGYLGGLEISLRDWVFLWSKTPHSFLD